MFCDFNWEQKEGVFFINSISDGTTNNDIFMAFGSSANNRIRFSIASGGVNYVNEDSAVLSSGRYKIAFAYASNDAVVYINGTQLFTSSTLATTVPDGYYSNGTNVWTASGGVLNFAISCASLYTTTTTTTTTVAPTTTTTTTAAPTTTTTTTLANCNFGDATAIIEYSGTAYNITTAAETDGQACNEIDNNQTIYGNNTTWLTVTRFYTNSGMTIPFDGFGSWYNEYNASTSYVHQIDNDGYIVSSFDCSVL